MRNDRHIFALVPALRAALVAALVALASGSALANGAPQAFSSPGKAVDALVAALRTGDAVALQNVFGDEGVAIIDSEDPVQDAADRARFLELYDELHRIDATKKSATLVVGNAEWPFPIPLAKGKGGWAFDAAAGREEILNRRIGKNELMTIEVLLEVVDAQRAYASRDWDDDGLLEYAQEFLSGVGRRNGLFWPTEDGEPPSPLGLLVDEARGQGYSRANTNFHGYRFRLLTAQGPDAPGGARDYMVRGNLIGGFAVIAWPVAWGDSGVMTFMVGYDGVVLQKDLGEATAELVEGIEAYDPDSTWSRVPDEDRLPVAE